MQCDSRFLVKLTWLRGIAASLVVASHSISLAEGKYSETAQETVKSLTWYFDLGSFGVMLFFALSGSTLYFSNKNISGVDGVVRFYVKRFMRIWPTYAIAFLVYVLFIPIFRELYISPQGNWVEHQFLTTWDWLDFISYLSLTANIWGQVELFNSAFWSLPVEFQYYMIFPLIILSLRFTGLIGPTVIAVFLFAIQKHSLLEVTDRRVFEMAYTFCFGVLLAYLYEKTKFRIKKIPAVCIFIVSMSLCSLAQNGLTTFADLTFISNTYGWNGVAGLVCFACVLFCTNDMQQSNWMVKPFYYLGEISFSLYLYHNLVIATFLLIILSVDGQFLLRSPIFIFIVVMPITIPLASLSYRYVEQYSIQYGKYLTKKASNKTELQMQSEKIDNLVDKVSKR